MSIVKLSFDVELELIRHFAVHDKNVVWCAFVK